MSSSEMAATLAFAGLLITLLMLARLRVELRARKDEIRGLREGADHSSLDTNASAASTELADAKRIVDHSSTVLFRAKAEPNLPITYISENVRSLGYSPGQFLE